MIPSLSPVLRIFVPVLRLFNRNSWDSLSRINQLRRPIMFIKCGMDEIIPSYMTDKLREECNKYHIHNYLYELPNGRHNEVHIADPITYFNQLNEFFSATLWLFIYRLFVHFYTIKFSSLYFFVFSDYEKSFIQINRLYIFYEGRDLSKEWPINEFGSKASRSWSQIWCNIKEEPFSKSITISYDGFG